MLQRNGLLEAISEFLEESPISVADLAKGLLEQTPFQHKLCSMIDFKSVRLMLASGLISLRDRARLHCIYNGDSTWLSIPPNAKKFNYLNRSQFTSVFRYWFGLPCQVSGRKCRCGKIIDLFGDHALTCKKGGGVVFRHDLVKKVLFIFAKEAGMNPLHELADYKLNAKDRIGDIVFKYEDNGNELLVDVTVWNSLYLDRLQNSATISDFTAKLAHMEKLSRRQIVDNRVETQFGWFRYMPFACDTFGGSTQTSKDLMNRIAQEWPIKKSKSLSDSLHFLKSRVSFAIQKGVSRALVMRNIDARCEMDDLEELVDDDISVSGESPEDLTDEEDVNFALDDVDWLNVVC